jgi:arylsulfatase A-like enzyme
MKSLTILITLFSLLAVSAGDRPNILYIFTDDQSTRTVACYPDAHPWVKTPNIDALAAEGVRFSNVYMAPFCVASRISQLTGNLPHSARGTFNEVTLTGEKLKHEIRRFPFWPQRLRESGYHTGMIGKWHIYSRMPAVGVDWDMAVYWHKKIVNAYYYDQKVSVNGAQPIDLNGYSVDRHTDYAIDYIKDRANGEQPWYLWLCYSSPHSPQTPAKRHQGSFSHISDHQIPLQKSFSSREGKPNYVQNKSKPKTDAIRSLVRRYQECILSIDENVGRLTKTLRETGQLENTVIVFTSDQGLAMGHHGHVKKKNAPYDATLTASLIFRCPSKFPRNAVRHEPVNGPDVVQTLHELTGLKARKSMDGESLVPLLKNPAMKLRRRIMLMTNTRTSFSSGIPNGVRRRNREAREIEEMPMWVMIRSGEFKYASYTGDGFEEIYDLRRDPEELKNIALIPERHHLLEEMRHKAAKELAKTQSGFKSGHFIDYFPHLRALMPASE